jgi:hypothetical protein
VKFLRHQVAVFAELLKKFIEIALFCRQDESPCVRCVSMEMIAGESPNPHAG